MSIAEKINNFFLIKWLRRGFVLLLSVPVKIYQWIISPMLPASCRYEPTCSSYAIEALRVHGPIKGLIMGTRRILSCHPWGGHGHDPVPPKGTPLFRFKKYRVK
jgi:uncharacterized protein